MTSNSQTRLNCKHEFVIDKEPNAYVTKCSKCGLIVHIGDHPIDISSLDFGLLVTAAEMSLVNQCEHEYISEGSDNEYITRCKKCGLVKYMHKEPHEHKFVTLWNDKFQPVGKECVMCKYREMDTYYTGFDVLMETEPKETFDSGAVREKVDLPRYDSIPVGCLRRLAKIYAEGSSRYGEYNWQKGIPASNIINHAMEHWYNYKAGNRDVDHLAKIAWAIFTLMWYQDNIPEMFDESFK